MPTTQKTGICRRMDSKIHNVYIFLENPKEPNMFLLYSEDKDYEIISVSKDELNTQYEFLIPNVDTERLCNPKQRVHVKDRNGLYVPISIDELYLFSNDSGCITLTRVPCKTHNLSFEIGYEVFKKFFEFSIQDEDYLVVEECTAKAEEILFLDDSEYERKYHNGNTYPYYYDAAVNVVKVFQYFDSPTRYISLTVPDFNKYFVKKLI